MKSITHLMQRACRALAVIPSEAILPLVEYSGNEALLNSMNLSEMEELGLELVIKYGNLLRYGSVKASISLDFRVKVIEELVYRRP